MINNVNLIVCCDANYGIGLKNRLPWKNSAEMTLFRSKTIGNKNNCVIMGRNTAKSIPKSNYPLKDRYNCVLSSTMKETHKMEHVVTNVDDLINWIKNTEFDKYWVIGGKQMYDLFLHHDKISVNEIHISILDETYECDTMFNASVLEDYSLISSWRNIKEAGFTHYEYSKKKT